MDRQNHATARKGPRIFSRALKSFAVIAFAFGCVSAAAAQRTVPLPPIRPNDLQAVPPPDATASQPTVDDNDLLRAQVLASRHVIGKGLSPLVGEGGCGIEAPLLVEAIVLADGAQVSLSPPVFMRASLASAVADWVREDLAPAAAATGDRLARIEGMGGYECRSRDGIAGSKLSEHATGNALDFEAFVTEHGKRLAVAASASSEPADIRSFLALVKKTACLRFATVLGPGSDSYHAQHLHIDLAARRNGTHLCQWNLQDAARDDFALAWRGSRHSPFSLILTTPQVYLDATMLGNM